MATEVIFGLGPLGLALADHLISNGRKVRLASRSKRDSSTAYDWVSADASNPEDVKRAIGKAETVYLCATPAYARWHDQYLPLIDGFIVGAAATNSRVVYADNLYAYGRTVQPLRETLPHAAHGPKGKTRALVAERLMNAHRAGRLRVTIGRAADFYGPRVRNSTLGAKIFESVKEGRPVYCLGDIDAPHTYTYIDNFARGLITLGSHPEAFGQAWHIPSSATLSTRALVTLIGDAYGKKPRYRAASGTTVNLLSFFNPMMRELKEVFHLYEQPLIMDCGKFVAAFGDASKPHQDALRETADWVAQSARKVA